MCEVWLEGDEVKSEGTEELFLVRGHSAPAYNCPALPSLKSARFKKTAFRLSKNAIERKT